MVYKSIEFGWTNFANFSLKIIWLQIESREGFKGEEI